MHNAVRLYVYIYIQIFTHMCTMFIKGVADFSVLYEVQKRGLQKDDLQACRL